MTIVTAAADPRLNEDVHRGMAAHAALAYGVCQLLGWGINTVAQLFSAISTVQQPSAHPVLEIILLNLLALGFTHLLRREIKLRHWHLLGLKALLPRMLASSLLLGLPIAILMHFMSVAPLWSGSAEDIKRLPETARWIAEVDPLLLRTFNWSALFFIWLVIYLCLTSLRDRRSVELQQSELTRALQLAELRVLKSQLNPHFLFNSLNSVRALISDDPGRAQLAVTQLARTLRYTLSAEQEELVSLAREFEIVDDYLELEALRLGDRLKIERHIAATANGIRIPVMLLQTVVENAIKHGIAELPSGGVLKIRADVKGDALIIEVSNPRPSIPTSSSGDGVGLHNAGERLRLLFGTDASLQLDLASTDLALTSIRIPRQ